MEGRWHYRGRIVITQGSSMQIAGLTGALALLFVAPTAFAAEPQLPVIPDRPAAELFQEVPAPWRDYLIKAREAERIADPLQRCLAYPDLPGNRWPEGHARAHCLDHAVRAMPMSDAQKLLDAGKLDELDAYVRRVQADHARKTDASEEVHYFFKQFSGADADAFTAAWLKAAPENPYALTARAQFYSGRASDARGGKFASETPREDLRQMTTYYEMALPLYRKALQALPGFQVPWIRMLALAYRDSRDDLEQEAFAAANRIDPACMDLADIRMASLQPRWGGSYDAMLAYAQALQPFLLTRPNLAQIQAEPYGDRGDWLIDQEKAMGVEASDILEVAVRTAAVEDHLHDAANVALNRTDGKQDTWKAVAYLMQQARFRDAGEWDNRMIAKVFVRSDPALALRFALKAIAADPDAASAHYYLAASNYNTKRFEEAEKHYLHAAKDPDWAKSSLSELVQMWMFDAGLSPEAGARRARPFLDRLLASYPDYGRAWFYRVPSDAALNGSADDKVVQTFLKYADKDDPQQAKAIKMFEAVKKAGGPKAFMRAQQAEAKP